MLTECTECDKPASGFHGRHAYCKHHLDEAVLREPDAHSCPVCEIDQPRHVMWERKAPCRSCQDREKRRRSDGKA